MTEPAAPPSGTFRAGAPRFRPTSGRAAARSRPARGPARTRPSTESEAGRFRRCPRTLYFQDGPHFVLDRDADVTVLA
ncbi:hypothetical protein ACWEQ2_45730, partial [Streptomyces sp. NPDC004096]